MRSIRVTRLEAFKALLDGALVRHSCWPIGEVLQLNLNVGSVGLATIEKDNKVLFRREYNINILNNELGNSFKNWEIVTLDNITQFVESLKYL